MTVQSIKEVLFIRHAESAANAGLPTSDPASIPLTEKGVQDAIALSNRLDKPDLFIVTPYIRTQQTAQPTLNKYPDVPVETWSLQEYNFLSPSRCVDTTVEERKPWVLDYWGRCDPDHVDGEGAESFHAFQERVVTSIQRLERLPFSHINVFTHGQVIRAIVQYMDSAPYSAVPMVDFRDHFLVLPVSNAQVIKAIFVEGRWFVNNMSTFG